MPFVKGDGIFTGPEAVVTNVFMHLPLQFDGYNIAPLEILGAADKVVMVGYYQGTKNLAAMLLWPMPHMYEQLKTVSLPGFSRQ